MSTETFPPDVVEAARAAQGKWNIPASVSLAQWVLESAWGTAMPAGSHNPFGIKARAGQPSVTVPTHEVLHGRWVKVTAAFAKFSSVAAAFDAHGKLLATAGVYARARAALPDAHAFAHALTGVYATDPHYGDKLVAIIDHHGLTAHDRA